jgi:hypothetical protein
MQPEHSAELGSHQNDGRPPLWGGVVLVTCGALLMLLPMVSLSIGVSGQEIDPKRSGDTLLGPAPIGLAFSFFGGGLILLTGIGEVQKYPRCFRVRAAWIASTIISISLALMVGFVILFKSAHYRSGRMALTEPSDGQTLEEMLGRTDRQIATLEKMQGEAAAPDPKTDKLLKTLYEQKREVIGQLFPSAH